MGNKNVTNNFHFDISGAIGTENGEFFCSYGSSADCIAEVQECVVLHK